MNLADELAVTRLAAAPERCLRLLRNHRPADGQCRYCRAPSTPDKPCRPYRLARIAAYRMEHDRDR
uniref:hypothetical protein n=1 Tax=Pseudonocardia sp. CA-138482 TaxID=3240023 RepID=UPI003F491290